MLSQLCMWCQGSFSPDICYPSGAQKGRFLIRQAGNMWPQRDCPCSGEPLYPDTQRLLSIALDLRCWGRTSRLHRLFLCWPFQEPQPDPKNCWRSTMFPAALAKNPTSGPWLHLVLTSYIRLSANPVGSVNLNPKPKSFQSSLASSCLRLATVISCLGESSGPFTGLQPQPLPSCSPSIQQPERSFGNRNRTMSPSALTLLLFQLKPQPQVGRPSLCHPPPAFSSYPSPWHSLSPTPTGVLEPPDTPNVYLPPGFGPWLSLCLECSSPDVCTAQSFLAWVFVNVTPFNSPPLTILSKVASLIPLRPLLFSSW